MRSGAADTRIAVLSDTHGLLRDSVLPHLDGVNHILHAGDVGDPAILERLREFAPVTAIRGNIDHSGSCALLPAAELIEIGGTAFYLVHSLADLDIEPLAAGVQVVVTGHSHKPALEERRGVTYLNPGSVGPRRFKLPISMATVRLRAGEIAVEFLTLEE
ncbi:metallophosphoesterase family protein [Terriglobus aquaticus]|uniref:Phosphoesterase n=1 Tax=Terriglobus aquaticus TaxID=940139 RepID=A0ABW9KKT9_9BACT|nr:metallophosphoesterase family protein [Terriglobus aquaticus]